MEGLATELAEEKARWQARQREGLLKTGRGLLTPHGVRYCEEFFGRERSVLAVAYLLGISCRSVERRYKDWRVTCHRRESSARADHDEP
jgi:hypothetical protein